MILHANVVHLFPSKLDPNSLRIVLKEPSLIQRVVSNNPKLEARAQKHLTAILPHLADLKYIHLDVVKAERVEAVYHQALIKSVLLEQTSATSLGIHLRIDQFKWLSQLVRDDQSPLRRIAYYQIFVYPGENPIDNRAYVVNFCETLQYLQKASFDLHFSGNRCDAYMIFCHGAEVPDNLVRQLHIDLSRQPEFTWTSPRDILWNFIRAQNNSLEHLSITNISGGIDRAVWLIEENPTCYIMFTRDCFELLRPSEGDDPPTATDFTYAIGIRANLLDKARYPKLRSIKITWQHELPQVHLSINSLPVYFAPFASSLTSLYLFGAPFKSQLHIKALLLSLTLRHQGSPLQRLRLPIDDLNYRVFTDMSSHFPRLTFLAVSYISFGPMISRKLSYLRAEEMEVKGNDIDTWPEFTQHDFSRWKLTDFDLMLSNKKASCDKELKRDAPGMKRVGQYIKSIKRFGPLVWEDSYS